MRRLEQIAILLQDPVMLDETGIYQIEGTGRAFFNHAIQNYPHIVEDRHRVGDRTDVWISGDLVDKISPTDGGGDRHANTELESGSETTDLLISKTIYDRI